MFPDDSIFSPPSFVRNCWCFSEVFMMKKLLSSYNKHIMKWNNILIFSADGNFEVTLATKATLHYTGDVAWKPPAIYHSSCEVRNKQNCFLLDTRNILFSRWMLNISRLTSKLVSWSLGAGHMMDFKWVCTKNFISKYSSKKSCFLKWHFCTALTTDEISLQ